MANLPESNEWSQGIYQLETSDPVLGGPEGIDNLQAKQLASRTRWLKGKIEAFIEGAQSVGKALMLATGRTISITGAGTGSTVFDGSADAEINLTLADSGIAAGSYAKVTVSAKGLVVGNADLLAADIPSLNWSKITTGKPTTLSGYGVVLPTQAQAEAGTDHTLPMTPLRVFQASSPIKRMNVFTSSGSWTCPEGVTSVLLDGCGGGAGGAGANGTVNAGEGGGAGDWVFNRLLSVVPGQVYTLVIGHAGQGGTLNADGTPGGVTTFGALLSLAGGIQGSKSGVGAGNGAGMGQPGGDSFALGGTGGSGFFGFGGASRNGNGTAGTGYGSGGAGGAHGYPGGSGSKGFISIRW